jgi:hypothetical protein
MTQPSTRRHVALATLALAAMTAAACGHSSPAAPEAATTSNDAAAIAPTALSKPGSKTNAETFPLSGRSFTIQGPNGDQITGEAKSGESTIRLNGPSTTTLTLVVTGGTGALSGASGVLDGKGSGVFTGEGYFALEVSGFLSTGDKRKTKFTAAFEGSATVSCESPHVIVSLSDSNNVNQLTHEVGNAGCF